MKIYPYEDDTIYAYSGKELGLTQRARVVNIFKEYNWNTEDITNDKRKVAADKGNDTVVAKLVYFGVDIIVNGDTEIDISDITPLDVAKLDRDEKAAKDKAEDDFDYRDHFRFK